jgi:hypothetical protein
MHSQCMNIIIPNYFFYDSRKKQQKKKKKKRYNFSYSHLNIPYFIITTLYNRQLSIYLVHKYL